MFFKKKIKRISFLWNQYKRYIKEKKYKYKLKEKDKMKINIIVPDASSGWIIYKFGKTVFEVLKSMEYDVTMSDKFDEKADINHYFKPNNVGYSKISKVDNNTTFMITHVDTMLKVNQIIELTKKGAVGICMSAETCNKLIQNGVKRNKICYINPAQDGQLSLRKITLGFTYRTYKDCRKRDDIIVDVCQYIKPDYFKFVIMGAGWDDIVLRIRQLGFEVEYYNEFDKEKYNEIMPYFDYYCYFGFDEGSMGFLDALACGVKTIVTPQGYHLDTNCGITYPVNTIDDIVKALLEIQNERVKYKDFVNTWTWENYVLKHLEIWKYQLKCIKLEELLKNRGKYMDGIFSLLLEDLEYDENLIKKIGKI